MTYVTRFVRFWYDFVVGDDWLLAVFVVLAVVTTAALAGAGRNPWSVLPAAVALVLPASLWRATRRRASDRPPGPNAS
jgi:hypothetical protein